MPGSRVFVGIDLGTSGCRAVAIDSAANPVVESGLGIPPPYRNSEGASEQSAEIWWQAVMQILGDLQTKLGRRSIAAISVNGTSASLLLCDKKGKPLVPAMMYDDSRGRRFLARIEQVAPSESPARSATSSLAKALYMLSTNGAPARDLILLHQAEWILGRLSGNYRVSDENNALKMGYDTVARCWPDWLTTCLPVNLLPEVYPPGTDVAPISRTVANQLALSPESRILTGTTDSTAAALATGIRAPGQAVSSLGSTLVVKVLSTVPVCSQQHGVYSHRLGDLWLAGGASNSGGAVLSHFFDRKEMNRLEAIIDPEHPTGLAYYPLLRAGERFPFNDPDWQPRLSPRPAERARFFQGLLEGIAGIEAQGYRFLAELGAPFPNTVLTSGGGAANQPWQQIRARRLGIPVVAAKNQQAAYGSALLAMRGMAGRG